jgi:hypothetical protein
LRMDRNTVLMHAEKEAHCTRICRDTACTNITFGDISSLWMEN